MRECGIVVVEMVLIQAKQVVELKNMESGCTFSGHLRLERRNKRNGQCLLQGLRRGEKVQGTGDGGDACKLESKSETGARVWS